MLRRWLAKKLYPEAFKDGERLFRLRHWLDDLRTWCGSDFPEIADAVEWLNKREHVHFMLLDDFDQAVAEKRFDDVMVNNIDRFRDAMRAKYERAQQAAT